MTKVSTGRFFEDFAMGQRLLHAVPRTLHGGDIALYMALTGERPPLSSSTELARSLGFLREVVPDLLVFHVVSASPSPISRTTRPPTWATPTSGSPVRCIRGTRWSPRAR